MLRQAHLKQLSSTTRIRWYLNIFYFNNQKRAWAKVIQQNTTVTLPKPTVGRRSASKTLENRATSADCRPTSVPILAYFLVGRRLFCRSTQVKSFVDRSADFHWIWHRWSVGRWSPDDRPTVSRRFEENFIMKSIKGRPIIGR